MVSVRFMVMSLLCGQWLTALSCHSGPRQQPLRALKDQLILIRDGKFRDGKVDFAAQTGKLPRYGMVASVSVCWTTGKR
jgi:hypothetical protein